MPTIILSLGNDLKKRFSLLLVTSVLFEFYYFHSKKEKWLLQIGTFHGMFATHFRCTQSYVRH